MRAGTLRRTLACMARQPRNVLPPVGAYHVINRGVERRWIFGDVDDYSSFLGSYRRVVRAFGWTVYAYVLMPNHFHIVVVTELEKLSKGMHRLSFRYAEAFNAKYERTGHLFQGRFKAFSLDEEDDLGRVCAYVYDNPVRVGLCDAGGAYPWAGGDFYELVGDVR
jgi:putative transposase